MSDWEGLLLLWYDRHIRKYLIDLKMSKYVISIVLGRVTGEIGRAGVPGIILQTLGIQCFP